MYTIIIEADENDGDYVTGVTCVDESMFLIVSGLFQQAGKILGKRWPRIEDYDKEPLVLKLIEGGMSRDDAESLSEWIPIGEYGYSQFYSFRYVEGSLKTLELN